jgi:O-antigen/teichoic acid export membrane protein
MAPVDTARQARGAQLAFAVQVAGVVVSYALQVVLARSLGPAGFGSYSFVLAWTGPLAMLAGLGLPTVALRFLPVYKHGADVERVAGLVRLSERIALATSVGIALLASAPALLWIDRPVPLLVGLWTLPLAVQLRIQSELARSAQRFRLAFVVPLIQQLLMLAAALLAQRLTPVTALLLPAFATIAVLPWQRLRLRRNLRRELGIPVRERPPAVYEPRRWLTAGAAFLAIEASYTVLNQADALLVGGLAGAKALALFSAAASTGSFAGLVMVAVGAAVSPSFAPLWEAGDREGLNELAQRAVRWTFWPQLGCVVVLIALSGPLLGLFGHGFSHARWALVFLFLGQLANTATGYIGTLMATTDNQLRSARWIWLAALANVAFVTTGLHVGGVSGAAAGTAISTLGWNLWLYRLVRVHVGVRASIVDAMLRRPAAI